MSISSNSRKAGPFIGNGTTSTFPFTFKVFATSDLEVVKLTVATSVETILVLNTGYTATLNEEQNSNPGGSITLTAGPLATGFNLVITSDIQNLQPTDLTNQGGFYPSVINDSLDRATIQIQQLQEAVDRSAKLPITSAEDADALVADIVRLADSAANIDIVAGSIANVNIDAAAIANINTVAGSIANVNVTGANIANVNAVGSDLLEPVSEINTVAVDIANVNSVGSNIANVNTVGTNIGDVNICATNIAAIVAAPAQAIAAAASATAAAGSATTASTAATNAGTSATNAASSATSASTSATSASGSATSASTSATNAASSASSASTSATNAAASASGASTSASSASTSATSATASATAASTSATNAASSAAGAVTSANAAAGSAAAALASQVAAEAALDQFTDIYLGAKASDPIVDNDGGPLAAGMWYFNTTSNISRMYNGSSWADLTVSSATVVAKTSSTGSAALPAGTTGQRDGSPSAGYLRFNSTSTEFEGYNGTAWSSVGGSTISNDTATSTNIYPLLAGATSGTAATVYTSNAKLLYKPSTGEFRMTAPIADNGLVLNKTTVNTSYTIQSGENAMSVGPITIAGGVTVTITSGQRWVTL